MARLKVLYPGNHTSSGNIGADIENVVRYLNSAEIADNTLSELLAKILQKLCKKKYLVAIKGPNGGYKIKKQLNSISLIKFIEDIEGPVGITKCSIDLECEQIETCNIKSPIDKINQNIRTMLSNTSLSELTN